MWQIGSHGRVRMETEEKLEQMPENEKKLLDIAEQTENAVMESLMEIRIA